MQKRIFIGASLSDHLRDELITIQSLYADVAGLRWLPANNLHLTIHFLGNVLAPGLSELRKNIKKIAEKTKPFELTFDKICFGPKAGSADMIWSRFQGNQAWQNLVARVREASENVTENKSNLLEPIPHVTIARWNKKKLAKNFGIRKDKLCCNSIKIDSFHLYQSKLSQKGSKYMILETFKFGK